MSQGRTFGAGIWRAHDALTRAGFLLGGAALAGIVVTFLIEVVARYFFNSPTLWSASAVAYLLCAAATLAMPELARTRGHIGITILEEKLPTATQARFIRIIAALTAIVCSFAAYMIWVEAIRQVQSGTSTSFAVRIPKIWLSGLICYGFTGTAIYYLRAALAPDSLPWNADEDPQEGL
ncbi:TRAP transporter small permease [Paracoccus homiensis]|uniref:TRAP transporter small permease protein n=1 Tax=Paracoccus homiensis TaxID=364199 RepID=A0A1I0D516_9RHOB|nr:TRAP transporter small permease subunit [Paracoccus homiensis]SET27240.1 TRAP-type C4-dicarboxylate transport system, small permease component [Paracoccus homiensis]